MNTRARSSALFTAIALSFGLAGCIVITKTESPAPIDPSSPDAAVCAEIDAAGKLDFDSSRLAALNAIAARTNLSPVAQVRLVKAVFGRLRFESSQMAVLQTLIQNPSFSNGAKQTLLVHVPRMQFDSNKSALLRMINDRGELKV